VPEVEAQPILEVDPRPMLEVDAKPVLEVWSGRDEGAKTSSDEPDEANGAHGRDRHNRSARRDRRSSARARLVCAHPARSGSVRAAGLSRRNDDRERARCAAGFLSAGSPRDRRSEQRQPLAPAARLELPRRSGPSAAACKLFCCRPTRCSAGEAIGPAKSAFFHTGIGGERIRRAPIGRALDRRTRCAHHPSRRRTHRRGADPHSRRAAHGHLAWHRAGRRDAHRAARDRRQSGPRPRPRPRPGNTRFGARSGIP
jgi:hypothetical protein